LLTHQSPATDRRTRLRFPLSAELRYQISGRGRGEPTRGTGIADNISSKGLAFYADGPVERGMRLSVSLAWPAKLDNQCTLRLVLEGTVLRTQGNLVVIVVERSEFRTAGTSTGAAREEIAAMTAYVGTPMALKRKAPAGQMLSR
jgi:hypothetical protein